MCASTAPVHQAFLECDVSLLEWESGFGRFDVGQSAKIKALKEHPQTTWKELSEYAEMNCGDANDTWSDVLVVTKTNYARARYNAMRAQCFAKKKKTFVFRWRGRGNALDSMNTDALWAKCPEVFGFFVPGAPAICTVNMCPELGIGNGSEGVMRKLAYSDNAINRQFEEVMKSVGDIPFGSIIDIPMPDTEVLEVNEMNVPIAQHRSGTSEADKGRSAVIKDHCQLQCEIFFACTYHKVQGRSMDRIIVDLTQVRGFPHSLPELYVAVSRSRTVGGVRRIGMIPANFSNPYQWDSHVLKWLEGASLNASDTRS